ncbi:chromosomal replication initiator protein DnaA [Alistipes sp. OttesenSCG-928-L06]|nr:chromosomal replication initiator protein DnaA [Alistipes sp. OttesenSCG-928-L06]
MLSNTEYPYNDVWQSCLSQIKEQTSEEEFVKWFKPIVPIGFDGTILRLRVPNESYVAQIEKNYIPVLRPIIHQLFGLKTRLRYSVPKTEALQENNASNTASSQPYAGATQPQQFKNPFVIPGIKKIVIDPQLNPNYCFDTFIEGECNRLTRSAGLAVAINPGKTPFNPLFIYGDSGLGKTHVAQAIGMEVKQRHPDLKVLYVTTSKFQAQFQNAATKGELNDFIHFYQMIDVLIVDDIQELAGKDKTQNTFFNIFNHLHLSFKQLIITSDKAPVELKDVEQRLITRFKWGLSTQLLPPDHTTKTKIIKSKAARLGTELPDDVVEFMSENITANVREIEGAISSLIANASFLNKTITVPLAREILKAYVKYTKKEITVERICQIVCDHYELNEEQFNSKKRTREIALARQVAMHLCKQHTKMPLSAIGNAIGKKNHATVLHACKTINNLMETDKEFRQQLDEIERKLRA